MIASYMRSGPIRVCRIDSIMRDSESRKVRYNKEHVNRSDLRVLTSGSAEKMACLSSGGRDKKGFGGTGGIRGSRS